jgi:DNA sulfur modification protein DndE
MKTKKALLITCLLSFIQLFSFGQWKSNGLPFNMPKWQEPVFKTDTFNIIKYGAVGDGIKTNTKAFSNAINECSKSGGGVVFVPAGLWLTGPIELKNNVNLNLAQGALVLFSSNVNDYPMVVSYWEGQQAWRCQSPISGFNLQNIAITGQGVFDGSGDAWRLVKKNKLTSLQWNKLISSGGIVSADKATWYPSEGSLKGNQMYNQGTLPPISDSAAYRKIKDYLRPVMVSLVQCKSVLLDGPVFQNSPSWCLHPMLCENLFIRNLTVRNPWYAQNGDGIDIESCSTGEVRNCSFDVGDDAICIKSGRDEEGRKRGKPTENFVITGCIVYHGHGGFVIGSEMSGGVRNLFVDNCTFLGTDIGLRFKTTRGRGGIVENIYVSNISMINIPTEAIRFDMYYSGTSPVPEGDEKAKSREPEKQYEINSGTPQFKDFYIRNIMCNGASQAIYLQGIPEMTIKNITIENSTFKTIKGITCIDGENIQLKNITLNLTNGDGAEIVNSKSVSLNMFEVLNYKGKLLKVSGERTSGITITGNLKKIAETDIETSSEVKSKVIIK